jgi:hypothetical protein
LFGLDSSLWNVAVYYIEGNIIVRRNFICETGYRKYYRSAIKMHNIISPQ